MFIVALFIVIKKWKPSRCLSVDKWINRIKSYNGIVFSLKKEQSADNRSISLTSVILSEKSVTKDFISYDSIYMKCPEYASPWCQKD